MKYINIGKMIPLSNEQIKQLHKKIFDATGGMDGLRDETMFASALSVAFHTFDGVELYPSIAAKISRIAYGLV